MQPHIELIVFDVNETLSDLAPMATRFAEVGAPEHLAKLWFAAILRDGFALTAAGASERFATLATVGLRTMLGATALNCDLASAVEHIMNGFADLPVHPDVVTGVKALRAAGLRLVTLTNGATRVAEELLSRAGILGEFENLLSVEDAGVWKPAARAYQYAARTCGTDPSAMMLVAVHPWDIDGAGRAGLQTTWINRAESTFPSFFRPPDRSLTSLIELATELGRQ